MIELPLKLKKQMLSFIMEYDKLNTQMSIKIKLPCKVLLTWHGEQCVDCDDIFPTSTVIDNIHETKEVRKINKRIEKFCKDTENFGKKYFGQKDWLWENILWEDHNNLSKIIKWI